MDELNIFLKNKLKEINLNQNLKIVLSDSNDPGEGEHKIMKYMDLNCNINDISIIYGLDADLIMLSMIRKHKVFLLRERTEFNFEGLDTNYVFLDIHLLKQSIIETLKKSFVKVPNETLLHDYLFMCFFIGNDFIINSPSINIRYSGLDRLLETYNELQQEYFGIFYFIDLKEKNKINENNLKLFLKKLAETEKESLKDILKIRGNQQNKYRRIYNDILKKCEKISITQIQTLTHEDFGTSVDRFDDFKNHSPVILRNGEDEIVLNDKKYYLHNFYNTNHYDPSFQMMLEEDKKTLCHEYIKSIVWTTQYYFGECPSWRWYYKYHFAPLFCDLKDNIDLNEIRFDNEQEKKPYSPEEQLKIVLPCQDDSFKYPKYTPLHSLMKRYFWECHPIMIN
jgi:5'-3' exonuclease